MNNLAPNFLLMIEPSIAHYTKQPVHDDWTKVAEIVWKALSLD